MRGILGADVFINLLLVFIITTGLLLMNTNNQAKCAKKGQEESELPKIALPNGSEAGIAGGKPGNALTLSAEEKAGAVVYFMDKQTTTREKLAAALKEKHVTTVKIRFDKNIAYGTYVEILDLCKSAGIRDIVNVYTTRQKEESK